MHRSWRPAPVEVSLEDCLAGKGMKHSDSQATFICLDDDCDGEDGGGSQSSSVTTPRGDVNTITNSECADSPLSRCHLRGLDEAQLPPLNHKLAMGVMDNQVVHKVRRQGALSLAHTTPRTFPEHVLNHMTDAPERSCRGQFR